MNNVEKLILEESNNNAIKDGNFIPSAKNNLDATIKVCSGDKNEVSNMEAEIAKYNKPETVKLEDLINTNVCVFDPHFGREENTELVEIKDSTGKVIDIVGFDMQNKIVRVFVNKNQNQRIEFDNDRSYGYYKGDKKIEGWCFDREDYIIDGYTSTGYYIPTKVVYGDE